MFEKEMKNILKDFSPKIKKLCDIKKNIKNRKERSSPRSYSSNK